MRNIRIISHFLPPPPLPACVWSSPCIYPRSWEVFGKFFSLVFPSVGSIFLVIFRRRRRRYVNNNNVCCYVLYGKNLVRGEAGGGRTNWCNYWTGGSRSTRGRINRYRYSFHPGGSKSGRGKYKPGRKLRKAGLRKQTVWRRSSVKLLAASGPSQGQ